MEPKSINLSIPNGPSFKVLFCDWTPPILMYWVNPDIEHFLNLKDSEVVVYNGKNIIVSEALENIKGYLPKSCNLIRKFSTTDGLLNKL